MNCRMSFFFNFFKNIENLSKITLVISRGLNSTLHDRLLMVKKSLSSNYVRYLIFNPDQIRKGEREGKEEDLLKEEKEGEHKHPNRHVRTYSLNRIFSRCLLHFSEILFQRQTDKQTNMLTCPFKWITHSPIHRTEYILRKVKLSFLSFITKPLRYLT